MDAAGMWLGASGWMLHASHAHRARFGRMPQVVVPPQCLPILTRPQVWQQLRCAGGGGGAGLRDGPPAARRQGGHPQSGGDHVGPGALLGWLAWQLCACATQVCSILVAALPFCPICCPACIVHQLTSSRLLCCPLRHRPMPSTARTWLARHPPARRLKSSTRRPPSACRRCRRSSTRRRSSPRRSSRMQLCRASGGNQLRRIRWLQLRMPV